MLLEGTHIGDVKAYLYEARVAPITALVDFARLTVDGLYKLDAALAEKRHEGTLPATAAGEQHTTVAFAATCHRCEVVESPRDIVYNLVIAKHITVERNSPVDVGAPR